MKEIHVFASVFDTNSTTGNLGDIFGYVLADYLCKPYSIKVNRIGINDKIVNNTFSLVGSICNLCNQKAKQDKKIIILGCGMIINDATISKNQNIVWKGVRGPLTLKFSHQNCAILSDPGLLISNIYPIIKTNQKKIGFIIHSVDRTEFFKLFPETKQYLIDNYSTYEEFTKQLSEYEKVVSSSLHGIIFCHSYSIPVCSIKVTNRIIGDNFKYIDYYHSIGHTEFKGRHTIHKNIDFQTLVTKEWQPSEKIIENFKSIQEKFILSQILEHI